MEYRCTLQGSQLDPGDWYLDYQDVKFGTSQRLTCTNNGTWETDLVSMDFCPTGRNSCRDPKIASCHDRTVFCLAPLPNLFDMEYFDVTGPGIREKQVGSRVLYKCINRGEKLF